MIDKEKVIEACETLKEFCDVKRCRECPMDGICSAWISPLMDRFIEALKNDRPTP